MIIRMIDGSFLINSMHRRVKMCTQRLTEEQHDSFCNFILRRLRNHPSLRVMLRGTLYIKRGCWYRPNYDISPLRMTISTADAGKLSSVIFEFAGLRYRTPIYINFIDEIVVIGNQMPNMESNIQCVIECAKRFFEKYPELLIKPETIKISTSDANTVDLSQSTYGATIN